MSQSNETQTQTKKPFPWWIILAVLGGFVAFSILTVIFGQMFGILTAWYLIIVCHSVAAIGAGFFVSLFSKDKNKKIATGLLGGFAMLILSVIFSFIAQYVSGFYDPLFELFDWLGGLSRKIAGGGLCCSFLVFFFIGVLFILFKLVNWKRLGKAIVAQPGIVVDQKVEQKPLSKKEQAEARRNK